MDRRRAADLLTEGGCYINTSQSGEPPIQLPDGSTIPVYLSCRRLIAQPQRRAEIETALSETVSKEFPSADLIVGIATAGITWAHAIASRLDLPMAYVRGQSKGYGVGKLVEGGPLPGANAVLVDDVLFTGKSIFGASKALMDEQEISTLGVASIATLNGEGVAAYRKRGIAAVALTDYDEILASGIDRNILSQDEAVVMRSFYQSSGLVE